MAAPGSSVQSKIATSPPSTRRRRGGRASALHAVRRSAPAGTGKVRWGPAAMGGACGATPRLAAAGCAKACRPRRWRFALVRHEGRLPRPVPASKSKIPRRAFDQAATWRTCKCLARGAAIGARWHGQGSMGPRRNGRGLWGYAPACCGRLCQACRPRRWRFALVRHEGRLPTRPPASLWSIHATPQPRRRNLRQGAFSLVVGVLALPASGRKPVKPSRGDAESATSPFGSGRPVRPWLVVNPGEGAAAPWASWPQPSSENNSPALRAFLAGQFFSLPGSPRCCDRCAVRPAHPPPAGSQQGRTGATLFNPKENIMANIGTFTAEKTASPASSAP